MKTLFSKNVPNFCRSDDMVKKWWYLKNAICMWFYAQLTQNILNGISTYKCVWVCSFKMVKEKSLFFSILLTQLPPFFGYSCIVVYFMKKTLQRGLVVDFSHRRLFMKSKYAWKYENLIFRYKTYTPIESQRKYKMMLFLV